MEVLVCVGLLASAVVIFGGLGWTFWRVERDNRRREEEYQRNREEVNQAFAKKLKAEEIERLRRKWGVR